jgi:hypothetical protein
MGTELGLIVAVLVAALGSIGGFAALMKVNADNSKTVSEGATNVVTMLRTQVSDLNERMNAQEEYSQAMEVWSGQVMDLLGKAIRTLPENKQDPFRVDAEALGRARPRKRSVVAKADKE